MNRNPEVEAVVNEMFDALKRGETIRSVVMFD